MVFDSGHFLVWIRKQNPVALLLSMFQQWEWLDVFLFCDGGEVVFWLWKNELYMSDLFWDKEVEVG